MCRDDDIIRETVSELIDNHDKAEFDRDVFRDDDAPIPKDAKGRTTRRDLETPEDSLDYTPSETKFYPKKGSPPEYEDDIYKWYRLRDRDISPQDCDSTTVRHSKLKRDLETLASRFELTDYQKERVCHLFDKLDTKNLGGYSAKEIMLGLIGAVAAEDGWADLTRTDTFASVAEDCDTTPLEVRAAWTALSKKIVSIDPYDPSIHENQ